MGERPSTGRENMESIEISGLTKKYGNTVAIDDISMKIAPHQIYGLVGPDGAGKTSLFRIICGILRPTRGTVRVLGKDIVSCSEQVKQDLGYMPQKFALYADLTVKENLDFFADLFKASRVDLEERKIQLLEFANLARFRERLAGNLSGGMKQKLALCCTLIHTPRLLVLDEPTTGVDPVSRQEFWDMLLPLPAQRTTVIVSTAYMDEAAKCDRISFMNSGRILTTGKPAELKTDLMGKLFEIRGDGLKKIKETLKSLNWVTEVQVFGDRLHVQVEAEAAHDGFALIHKVITEIGLESKVSPVEPSLEDVFVSLLEK